jgi:hypothetical protein
VRGTNDTDLVVVGVDTHLDSLTAALCDGRGRLVAQLQVPGDCGRVCAAAGPGAGASGPRADRVGGGGHPALRAGPGPASGCRR